MIVLGIESTAHTLGIGVVNEEGCILADCKSVYAPEVGGIHPREAAEHHQKQLHVVLQDVFSETGVSLTEVKGIAYAQGPGLPPALRIGAVMARTLAKSLGVPLLGVNHCVAHIEQARYFCKAEKPLVVYLSGGNTQITMLEARRYRIFGETLDIALGNMLDVFARAANLTHPGGPKIEQLAKQAKGEYQELPYTVKGMDLAFSGLLTAAKRLLTNGSPLETICYSLQETSFAMVAEVVERALAHTGREEVIVTGGVAANARLREMLALVAEEQSAKFASVPPKYAGDNGSMIAYNGLLMLHAKTTTPLSKSKVRPKWRLDQIDIPWGE
ncbi:MAG: KEOPS complex N(6)-L-threonylcarbamoyladenine synthase Kae1 [Candidatus Hermodarchaeota archaeon]|nr:KEOPS complex N(6)-L-threonylcarbamoyladenine synthase Kae1 [Candidatus Hermodarchaeota archaeon]